MNIMLKKKHSFSIIWLTAQLANAVQRHYQADWINVSIFTQVEMKKMIVIYSLTIVIVLKVYYWISKLFFVSMFDSLVYSAPLKKYKNCSSWPNCCVTTPLVRLATEPRDRSFCCLVLPISGNIIKTTKLIPE